MSLASLRLHSASGELNSESFRERVVKALKRWNERLFPRDVETKHARRVCSPLFSDGILRVIGRQGASVLVRVMGLIETHSLPTLIRSYPRHFTLITRSPRRPCSSYLSALRCVFSPFATFEHEVADADD
jgi:hypothetical protein